jgi:hypothetical protein
MGAALFLQGLGALADALSGCLHLAVHAADLGQHFRALLLDPIARGAQGRLGRAKRAESPDKHCLTNQALILTNATFYPDNQRVIVFWRNLCRECEKTGNYPLPYNDFSRFWRIYYQDEFVKIHLRKVFRGAKFADF